MSNKLDEIIKKIEERIKNKIPKYIKDEWYNAYAYTKDKKDILIFDEKDCYIDCKIGLILAKGETLKGEKIYYKVIKMWRGSGSDFLYDSDAIRCDLKFSHIEKRDK